MSRVFISYRRDDSGGETGRIYDRLVQRYGRDNVFKDVDSIPLGTDFRRVLDEAVGRCQVLLAVIGRQWLDNTGPSGGRLEDPRDFVRLEIEAALRRDIPVIPVLVGGATMPRDDQLPASLRPLAFRNGLAVRWDPDFEHDVGRLLQSLALLFQEPTAAPAKPVTLTARPRERATPAPKPAPRTPPRVEQRPRRASGMSPLMLCLAIIFLVIALIAGALGLFHVEAVSSIIAWWLFAIFLILSVISLALWVLRRPPV